MPARLDLKDQKRDSHLLPKKVIFLGSKEWQFYTPKIDIKKTRKLVLSNVSKKGSFWTQKRSILDPPKIDQKKALKMPFLDP